MKKEEVGNDNAGEPEHCVGHIALYISLYLKKLVKEEVLLNSPACPHRAHCVGAVRPSGGPGPPLLLFTSSSSSGIADFLGFPGYRRLCIPLFPEMVRTSFFSPISFN